MSQTPPISTITIKGYKSIENLDCLTLGNLNVLIGSNGAGKSNFISFFRLLQEMLQQRLQNWVAQQGGANQIFSFGIKHTDKLKAEIAFGLNKYSFELSPTAEGNIFFSKENIDFDGVNFPPTHREIADGNTESKLAEKVIQGYGWATENYTYSALKEWNVYHFHDTGPKAGMKLWGLKDDCAYLHRDGSNLAAFLYELKIRDKEKFNQVFEIVRLAVPFFEDFVFYKKPSNAGEQILLAWRQKGSDYVLMPSQFSDGTLRFICLTAVLLQPVPPATIIIDEPELGLHPYAVALLASMIRSAAKQTQVIISTQSVSLINEFSLDDLIIVERENNVSVFSRPKPEEFQTWLENYSVGEIWEKNLLGGRPPR